MPYDGHSPQEMLPKVSGKLPDNAMLPVPVRPFRSKGDSFTGEPEEILKRLESEAMREVSANFGKNLLDNESDPPSWANPDIVSPDPPRIPPLGMSLYRNSSNQPGVSRDGAAMMNNSAPMNPNAGGATGSMMYDPAQVAALQQAAYNEYLHRSATQNVQKMRVNI
eukprot:TRINITY_DN18231_c0_g1_i10.p2 TRINITY_DN18231_c0_g1~~TRINITY_DN18231_c0_g1_i10.p2  ORF type:complete len:166 (+),score=28.03 TRINITY_DN18231_c0_g1_i10:668-1165(+)